NGRSMPRDGGNLDQAPREGSQNPLLLGAQIADLRIHVEKIHFILFLNDFYDEKHAMTILWPEMSVILYGSRGQKVTSALKKVSSAPELSSFATGVPVSLI
ncbi:MAG: hypothetical protein ACREDT_14895, partial [Methylocella sp.]